MTRHRLGFLVVAVPLMAFAISSGCTAGGGRSPSPARRPSLTPPAIATPTATPTPDKRTPTPTATPAPRLPPNPRGLQRWSSFPVRYCVSPEGGYVDAEDFVALVEVAFAEWGIPVENTGPCSDVGADDGVNSVGWGSIADPADPEVYEAGRALVSFEECTANCDRDDPVRIVEADITIDADPLPEFGGAACLSTTLLHEAGHFLGLDHLDPPAVMAARTSDCAPALTGADVAALLERYGEIRD